MINFCQIQSLEGGAVGGEVYFYIKWDVRVNPITKQDKWISNYLVASFVWRPLILIHSICLLFDEECNDAFGSYKSDVFVVSCVGI